MVRGSTIFTGRFAIEKVLRLRGRAMSTGDLDTRKGERERVVILGSGWAG